MAIKITTIVFDYLGVIELSSAGDTLKKIAELISVPLNNFREVYFRYNHLSNVKNVRFEDMLIRVVSVFDDTENTKNKVS